jgi:hypothetical protein
MRKSDMLLLFITVGAFCLLVTVVDASFRSRAAAEQLAQRSELVKRLTLTDLALFTEARYTRHLSQADRHTGFQDHPLSMEHFPSGSLYLPPPLVSKTNEQLYSETEIPD